ncbi:MAG TPA: putative glycoside hydrolase [Solirubrobacteraceae bacterium]|jgi:hypothetical protein
MRSSTRAATAILACACALVLPTAGSAATVGHYDSATTTPAAFTNAALSAQRNTYIDLQAWEGAKAAELKAANPNLKVLVYQNLGAMSQGIGPNGLSSSGVNYAEANGAHPSWFLTGAGGERLAFEDFRWLWAADVANPEYQRLWAANVIRLLRSGPWDGVMMDDTNTTNRYHFSPASKVSQYPTDAAYQGAVRSMLEYVGPAIQAAGKLAIPNMGSWSEYPAVVAQWLPFVSGGMDEMFVKWSKSAGQGYRGSHEWEAETGEIATTESMGKQFIAITQAEPGDVQGARYGWASTLLAGNGHTVFMASNGHLGEETWLGDYETPLGTPTGAAAPLGNGAWQRQFSNGLVLVNPTNGSVSASFAGAYSGDGLTNATGAALAPHSALVLTRGGASASAGALARVATVGPGLLLASARFQPISGSGASYSHHRRTSWAVRCWRVKSGAARRHGRGTRLVCARRHRGRAHAPRHRAASRRA